MHKRKLAVGTVVAQTAGLRFFFVRTLKRRFPPDSIPYPKYSYHRVPKVLSPEEVAQLIDAASNLPARAILMLLYSIGMRRRERVEDIDSKRMIVHIRCARGYLKRRASTGVQRSQRPGCFQPESPGAATIT